MLAGLPDDLDRFREACTRVDDWSALLSAAHRHGVAGVVVAGVERAELVLPRSVAQDAAERARLGAVWRDALQDTLRKVLAVLNASGVRSVSLKGPLLALRLYGDDVVRPSVDLDLLVDPTDLPAVFDALGPIGYERESRDIEDFYQEHHHHVRMLHAALPTLELHFHAYRGFGTVLPAAPLIARAASSELGEWRDALVLSPEDEFLYLAVHAASHRFQSLVWLYDLKLLVLRHPGLRWDVLADRSESCELSTVVSFACSLLTEWLGLKRPDALSRVRRIAAPRALAAASLIRARSSYAASAATTFFFTLLLCDDMANAAAFLRRWGLRGLARASLSAH